jgi:Rps23 Pro-64 3,4-dihydroxylase Tpa1-like proline 4-hydroxylase
MQSTLPQSAVRDVKVTLLLAGGHQYTLNLKSNDPLLHNLVGAIVAHSQQQAGYQGIFQIPLHQERSALCFSSERLIGVVTEPPMILQMGTATPQPEVAEPQAMQKSMQSSSPGEGIPAAAVPAHVLPSHYVQLDNFLTSEEKNHLLDYVLQYESAFVSTSTSTGDTDYRRSMVLHSFPEFAKLLTDRVRAALPEVFRQLKLQPFSIAEIEAQLTSHNHGNYYKVHNDNGSPDTATREFTYVYYFYREPKPFFGGELLLYDSRIENNFYVKADSFKAVEPRNNSIVFFPSRYLHEVLPVTCPSKAFADSRFTINGWVRRQVSAQ